MLVKQQSQCTRNTRHRREIEDESIPLGRLAQSVVAWKHRYEAQSVRGRHIKEKGEQKKRNREEVRGRERKREEERGRERKR